MGRLDPTRDFGTPPMEESGSTAGIRDGDGGLVRKATTDTRRMKVVTLRLLQILI
jgi:hypothetical protein